MTDILKSPFPYFGGKSRIAPLVWERFGRVQNFVEPFFGSGAVLLGCPHLGHTETVNDIDALLANFWRALQHDPAAVATAADWPVNEVDLHSRHRYLRDRRGWVEELMTDPDAYDAKLAGWWVWGISQWMGSGWCPPDTRTYERHKDQRPDLGGAGSGADRGHGVHRASLADETWQSRPFLSHKGQGGQRELPRKRPVVAGTGKRTHRGLGVHRASLHEAPAEMRDLPSRQIPHLGGGGGGNGRGITTDAVTTYGQMPHLNGDSGATGAGIHASAFDVKTGGLYAYFDALAARLRRVRVCCGDWRRVLGPSVTYRHGLTAVFLDPPYDQSTRADVYAYEQRVFDDVRQWAIENGNNPLLRIALCGYDFDMPAGWTLVPWKAHGGYGSQGDGRGRANAHREIVAFSPACIDPAEDWTTAKRAPESSWAGTLFEEEL